MPLLDWDETDVLTCLEVTPTVHDSGTVYAYEVCQGKSSLMLAVQPYESIVSIELLQAGSEIASWFLVVRGQIRRVKDQAGERLEFLNCVVIPSHLKGPDFFSAALFPGDLHMEVAVKPHICVRFL